jgi:hypothetical protein
MAPLPPGLSSTSLAAELTHRPYDIIRRQGPPDPLQLELTDWLDLHGVLDLHQYSRVGRYQASEKRCRRGTDRRELAGLRDSGISATLTSKVTASRQKAAQFRQESV